MGARRTDFVRSTEAEPHAGRKVAILAAHPEIKDLMQPDPRTKFVCFGVVAAHVVVARVVSAWSWPWFLVAVYVVGATAAHNLFLAIHEFSHNTGATSFLANKLLMMVANWPIVFPVCMTFKPYHAEHHRYQGTIGVDTDVPTAWEASLISWCGFSYPAHCLVKAVVLFFQVGFYIFRPAMVSPETAPPDRWFVASCLSQLAFDALIVRTIGWNGLLYLLLSIFFAGSVHPLAGHFIAEHYVTEGKAETYSYYGPLNFFSYNVGYHNEHHDFPNIPGSRLPTVRALAPEFYDTLPQCPSWPGALWNYIFNDAGGPYARVVRESKKAT